MRNRLNSQKKLKYETLREHLETLSVSEWKVSFSEIEKILGFRLPASARNYHAWWSNQDSGSRSHHWKKAGWHTAGVNLKREEVSFCRVALHSHTVKPLPERIEKALIEYVASWDLKESLACKLRIDWSPLGIVQFDGTGKLSFPSSTPKMAGLYRFRIRENGRDETRYVGESVNIHRRFNQNYRHGNASQHTSHRINNELKKALNRGAEIAISIVVDTAWITSNGKEVCADFNIKAHRRLFENFVQCVEGDCPIETLNL